MDPRERGGGDVVFVNAGFNCICVTPGGNNTGFGSGQVQLYTARNNRSGEQSGVTVCPQLILLHISLTTRGGGGVNARRLPSTCNSETCNQ